MSELLALPGFIVSMVAGVAGLIAVFVTLYVHFREHPRREFSWEVRYAPLVASRVHGLPKLSVAYDGRAVPNPHLVTIEVASTGRADISSSNFDGQKPVLFDLGVPVLDEVDQDASQSNFSARLDFTQNESTIRLAPALLPKQFSFRASYICEGAPRCQPNIELADTNIREGLRPKQRVKFEYAWLFYAAVTAGLVALYYEMYGFKP
ncbi:hypothetical protein ACPFL9_20390 [Paenarthrobacter sp. NyZ202]|uniref:hypothetical protein n=1 Tax=Paenarthrobacter sp. NyZ202 TaxID=3402689 RepID=UPI003CEDB565